MILLIKAQLLAVKDN